MMEVADAAIGAAAERVAPPSKRDDPDKAAPAAAAEKLQLDIPHPFNGCPRFEIESLGQAPVLSLEYDRVNGINPAVPT